VAGGPLTSFVDRVVELHRALDRGGVPHGFGGAIALIYGVADPRLTHDIDVNVAVPTAGAAAVFACLPPSLPWTREDVAAVQADGQVRLRWEPSLPVDLFFPQHDFHRVVAARTRTVTFAGEPLPVISPTDLTVFKALFNRRKDWADIEAMLEAGTVDTGDALGWVVAIVGADHPSTAQLRQVVGEARRYPPGPGVDPNVWRDEPRR
jgi:hypothetical protein